MCSHRVVELTEPDKHEYLCCLKTWDKCFYSERKLNWYNKKKEKGLCVKLIKDDKDNVKGMVQYLPAEESFVEGENIYLIQCIWINGYDEGVGNVQKKGLGTTLLKAVEEDVVSKGADGISAWGMSFEEWMPVSWYKKHGYTEADRSDSRVLVWKKFKDSTVEPEFVRPKKLPDTIQDKVSITIFNDGWCQYLNIQIDLTKQIVKEYGNIIVLKEYDTSDKRILKEWGIDNAILVDREWISFGPFSVEDQLRKVIVQKINGINAGKK